MRLITFNPLRTIGIPGIHYIKPVHMFKELDAIREADLLLFPEHWQVNSLVHAMHKPIFPSIEAIQLGYSKVEMTRAFWSICPEHVPYTEILANTTENREAVLDTFAYPFVAKENRNSMGHGVFLIENQEQFMDYAIHSDILYIQEYLPADRDLRVCIVGDEVVSAYWKIGEEGQFHHNLAKGGTISVDSIPQEALQLALYTARSLGINHAGFDILVSGGACYLLEFNVLFGNEGLRELGIPIELKIHEYIMNMIRPLFPTSPSTPSGTRKRVS